MNNAPAILKSLIIYAVIVPLAIFIGYLLTDPMQLLGNNTSAMAFIGLLIMVIVSPLLLRWHYALLLLCLNARAYAFFMKGNPDLWLVMVALSLGISMLERAMNSEKRFIREPQMTWPLLFLLAVVIFTAKLTGGIGLKSFGSEAYGGKKYVYLIIGILSYFALTARRIPPERAKLFLAFFLLGGMTMIIGDIYPIVPSALHFIFWVFPPNGFFAGGPMEVGVTRLSGIAGAASCFVGWMAARYGLRGIFLSRKLWRPVLFMMASGMIFLGGFRIMIISYLFIMGLMFYLEGLHRTRALPVFVMAGILMASLMIPLASHLPFTFQRALAFLPLNLSSEARQAAQDSSDWRVEMWKALLPQVPKYLLLGKGYAFSREDFEMMGTDSSFKAVDPSQQGLALATDYHNGPLSVVIPFGIWGVIAVGWLMIAGLRAMYCNFRYGDPALRTMNAFLFSCYLYEFLRFLFVYGAMNGDVMSFASSVGFSIALNGGICRPVQQPAQDKQAFALTKPFPRPRPAFQRNRIGL